MDRGPFKLTAEERERVLRYVEIDVKSFKEGEDCFCREIEFAIDHYHAYRARQEFDVPRIKKTLISIEHYADQLRKLTQRTLVDAKRTPDDEMVRTFLLGRLRHPESVRWSPADRVNNIEQLCSDLGDLGVAAKEASSLASQIKGRRKNNAGLWFVLTLEELYWRYTGRKAGWGRATKFGKFVESCFSLAGHKIADILPYFSVLQPDKQQ